MENSKLNYELIYEKAVKLDGLTFKEWEHLKEIVDIAFEKEFQKAEYTSQMPVETLERIVKLKKSINQ